jgi:hypothetical protein
MQMNLLEQLTDLNPEPVWGLVSRGIGLVFVVSFASMLPQLLPIAGRQGLLPIHDALRAIERISPACSGSTRVTRCCAHSAG